MTLSLGGYGAGVIGRWPLHENVQPFARADYLFWEMKANSMGKVVGKDNGASLGLALGVEFPIKGFFGLKVEALRYNDISGADIDHVSFGATFEFE